MPDPDNKMTYLKGTNPITRGGYFSNTSIPSSMIKGGVGYSPLYLFQQIMGNWPGYVKQYPMRAGGGAAASAIAFSMMMSAYKNIFGNDQ